LRKKYDFHPGAIRFVSKKDSSPITCPVTRLIPWERSCDARESRSSVDSVGSP
jgi:hypothetical protein